MGMKYLNHQKKFVVFVQKDDIRNSCPASRNDGLLGINFRNFLWERLPDHISANKTLSVNLRNKSRACFPLVNLPQNFLLRFGVDRTSSRSARTFVPRAYPILPINFQSASPVK